MNATALPHSFPNPTQEAFLKAALFKGDEATKAWREWKSRVDINDVDFASFRLLSALYKNLQKNGIDDPELVRLKGVYRFIWVKNHRRLAAVTFLIKAFEKEGIPLLFLKGIPLTVLAYRDVGSRYMEDVDILVPQDQTVRAIKFLRELGWRPMLKNLESLDTPWSKRFLDIQASCGFRDDNKVEIDVHWHLMYELVHMDPRINEEFWERAIPFTVHGLQALTLSPEDQLIHICVHGTRWNPYPPFRWVVDAMKLMETWPDLDWDRVFRQAERMKLVLPVREALGYLKRVFHADIPDSVLKEFAQAPVRSYARKEYKLSANRPRKNFIDPLPSLWYRYRRLMEADPGKFGLGGFLIYLKDQIGLDYYWQFPGYFSAKVFQRLFQKTTAS